MAARENQGLHIALILFVMLTVLLAVLSYFTFTSMNEMSDRLAAAEQERDTQSKLADAYRIQSDVLKMWIGFGNMTPEEAEGQLQDLARKDQQVAEEMTTIRTQYEEDMKLFDAAYTGIRNYRALPSQLEQTITKKNGTIDDSVQTEADLIEKMNSEIANANEARLVAEQKAADYQEDLNQQKETFRTTSDDIQQQQQASAQSVTNARDAEKKAIDEARDTIAEKDAQITQLNETVAQKSEMLAEYEAEEFDIADGRVTDVSSRAGIVWLNVGFEDNLPQNASFAVYPQDSTQFRKEGVKGMVEVKRILGAHVAEARITMESVSDPIMPGDVINTTTWSPGRQQAVAIAGFIDIDGDNRSDAQRLRNIITRNGGKVVAYINEEGNVEGDLDAKTRYLIVGDDPPLGSMDEAVLQNLVRSTTELTNRAREEVVERKYFQEMLEEMGYRGESSTQTVEAGGSGEFQPRRPPARGSNGGAY